MVLVLWTFLERRQVAEPIVNDVNAIRFRVLKALKHDEVSRRRDVVGNSRNVDKVSAEEMLRRRQLRRFLRCTRLREID